MLGYVIFWGIGFVGLLFGYIATSSRNWVMTLIYVIIAGLSALWHIGAAIAVIAIDQSFSYIVEYV